MEEAGRLHAGLPQHRAGGHRQDGTHGHLRGELEQWLADRRGAGAVAQ